MIINQNVKTQSKLKWVVCPVCQKTIRSSFVNIHFRFFWLQKNFYQIVNKIKKEREKQPKKS
eukprot:UN04012